MRSKAWLAASVWLRLARLPPPASRVRRSHRLRDKLAAAPGLLAHAYVTETVASGPMGREHTYTGAVARRVCKAYQRGRGTSQLAQMLLCARNNTLCVIRNRELIHVNSAFTTTRMNVTLRDAVVD
jgi:hypothetical protein